MRRLCIVFGVTILCVSLFIFSCGHSRTLMVNGIEGVFALVPDPYGMVLKAPDGQTVFRYMTKKPAKTNLAANSTCCFHPLYTPSGVRLTDLAPGDHHHHRGVFLAWHSMEFREKADFSKFGPSGPTRGWNIDRADFWGWGQYAPTAGRVIKNHGVKLIKADSKHAELEIRNAWIINEKTMMNEVTSAGKAVTYTQVAIRRLLLHSRHCRHCQHSWYPSCGALLHCC